MLAGAANFLNSTKPLSISVFNNIFKEKKADGNFVHFSGRKYGQTEMSYALWIFLKYLLQYIAFMLCTGFGRNGLWLLILFLWLFRLVYATGASMSEKKN